MECQLQVNTGVKKNQTNASCQCNLRRINRIENAINAITMFDAKQKYLYRLFHFLGITSKCVTIEARNEQPYGCDKPINALCSIVIYNGRKKNESAHSKK